MTVPALLFGFLISTLMGAGFHLWKGGSFGRLLLYLLLGWAGFWAGHLLGNNLDFTFGSIGPLRFGAGLVLGAATLLVGDWLSQINRGEHEH